MSRTLLKGAEAALPTTTGTAVSFIGAGSGPTGATVLRLVNTDSSAQLVTLVESPSGNVVGSFTMPTGTVEFLEKNPGQYVFAAAAGVKGSQVGFTG